MLVFIYVFHITLYRQCQYNGQLCIYKNVISNEKKGINWCIQSAFEFVANFTARGQIHSLEYTFHVID